MNEVSFVEWVVNGNDPNRVFTDGRESLDIDETALAITVIAGKNIDEFIQASFQQIGQE
jgi:hypothetical protein